MSGKDSRFSVSTSRAMGRLMDKIKRTVAESSDTPADQGYLRVNTAEGSLSACSTTTSLDTVLLDTEPQSVASDIRQQKKSKFSPIYEVDDQSISKSSNQIVPDEIASSKSSIKGSRVSFEQPDDYSSEEEEKDFLKSRNQFQARKTKSADHKGILKDLTLIASDNRRDYQSKKHVSHSKVLEQILHGSSSEEDFQERRKQFQARKHKSLDARVKFNLDKNQSSSSSGSDEEHENKRLIHERIFDFAKPVVIDFKDLDISEEEEDEDNFVSNRKHFQQKKSFSLDLKSHRYMEMDEIGKKGENIRQAIPFVRQISQGGKAKLEVYRTTTNPIYIYTQILAALSVSLGSLVVGFSSAYTSPALPSMQNRNVTSFEVTDDAGSWVGGIMPLAGLVGGILGGPFINILGRRNTILATAVPFIISWLLIALAGHVALILAGRALSGFCVGVASLSLPVYLGETVQAEVRGTLGLLPTAFGNIGILLCFVAGKYLDWSSLAFLGGALPVPFLLLMFFIPETPRWYVSKKQDERARKALQWLRGKQADVEPELKGIIKSDIDALKHSSNNGLLELFANMKPLSISLGLMFFQQFSGINAVVFYAEKIFIYAGTTMDTSLCVIIVGVVNFIATFVATVLIDRAGRKILLYISSVGMVITLGSLGTYFYLSDGGRDVSNISWMPLASLMLYVLCFSLGFGPIPWLMMGEILPAKIRGSAASVATAFNWTCTFIVTKTFSEIINILGKSGCFWGFGVICAIGLIFVIIYVPETQGKSLEDIERKMMGRVRRMSSVANMKPLSFNM